MSKQTVNFLELFKQKKYSLIISIIDEKIPENQRTAGLYNLKGVCRLMLNKSNESIKLAIEDFRKSYFKEENKSKSIDSIKNLINASVIYFDNEFTKNTNALSDKFFEEINFIYAKNKELFENNLDLMKSIIKVFKRTSDLENIIEYLKKIIHFDPDPDAIASYIFFNNYLYNWSQSDYLENAKTLNNKLIKYSSNELVDLKKSKNSKINLGFVSSDIRSKHSVTYFLRSVVSNYDNSKFQIYLYHNHNVEDDTTIEFQKYVFKTSRISKLNDKEVINLIRNDKIDIIIDLNGFSSNHRLVLFKNRLAPIQISWCGYPNTTGLDEMDYLIADKNLIKPVDEKYYSEKIIYLPKIWNCHNGYDNKRVFNSAPSIKKKFITFGSFNNFRKINDDVIEVWSMILKKVKNSKLILKTSSAVSQELYEKKFKKYDILSSISFLNYNKNFDDHLSQYKKIDIALDTFPYNGVTTSFEAIWMGVPVITMQGYNLNSRCGESININAQFASLIAQDKEDYIKKAISLAQDEKDLTKIRKNIYENALKTPLFDKKKFSDEFFSNLEKIYN